MIGLRFGRLVVLSQAPNNSNGARFNCVCDCGNIKPIYKHHLVQGLANGCGCMRVKHGNSVKNHRTREYRSWESMHARCSNSKRKEYCNYGGRGITVCERWNDFRLFLSDMGPCPEGLTIDRINNDGNYEPWNCRWATYSVQLQNRRLTKFYEANGERLTLTGWANKMGMKTGLLLTRLERFSISEILDILSRDGFIKKPRKLKQSGCL